MRKYSEYEKEQIRKKIDKSFWGWLGIFGILDILHLFSGGFNE